MPEPQRFVFGAFQLDLQDERLWCGAAVVRLPPKPFAVLACLVTRAGQLVTKDALLAAVWPDTVVSEDVLTVAMRQLRRALGDQTRPPQVIETVHGRGYRFIAPVRATRPPARPAPLERPRRARLFVGRDAELAHLAQWWTLVQQGQRQVGMLVGEPGIGKTALVDAFVAQVRASKDVWVGHGQCLDPYGAGEAYLPLLEALGRLGRGPEGASLVAVLRQYAPSWLVHLPALFVLEERERLGHTTRGVTPACMLRELAEALEVLTAARPLVLILEDLHWSDRATLEWLAYVVRRRDPARLLLLGTYRPVDVIVHAHPLRAILTELRHHPQYAELVLDYLSAAATAAYLRQRCGAPPLSPDLPPLVHQRTGGHPLFLVAMVDELVRQGLLETARDADGSPGALAVLRDIIPASLRQYIEQHLEQVSEADQALLDAASVAGSTFTMAAVAAGVAQAPELLEARATALARQGRFIRARGTETWPDGTVTACYQFLHTLYHEVVYARVSAGHRVRLHQQIGLRKEAGYGAQAWQIATELAVHFTRGRDGWRAVHYLHEAGENALRRSAYPEALTHLTMGLEVLHTLPATAERARQELALQTTLGPAFMAVHGYASVEVERVYWRARELSQAVDDTAAHVRALMGLAAVFFARANHAAVHALTGALLQLGQALQDPRILLQTYALEGESLLWQGQCVLARTYLEYAQSWYRPQQDDPSAYFFGHHPVVQTLSALAVVLWVLGYPERAVQQSNQVLTFAQGLSHPFSLAFALSAPVLLYQLRREASIVQAQAATLVRVSLEHGFPFRAALGRILLGWAMVEQGAGPAGMAYMEEGIAAWHATGAKGLGAVWLGLRAAAYGKLGQSEAGLALVVEALRAVEAAGGHIYAAELQRLQGAFLLQRSADHHREAETCFQQALTIARRQQAKAWELRAAMSLARLWQEQGKSAEAYDLLAPVYGWFTEGFETADLQEAKALLAALAPELGT
jgi:DNA-binding winged helix-turn-helix (wHTH) protein/predicted ATPase